MSAVFADQSFILQNSHRVEFPIDNAIRTTDFFFLHFWDYRGLYTRRLFDVVRRPIMSVKLKILLHAKSLLHPRSGLFNVCPAQKNGSEAAASIARLLGLGSGARAVEVVIRAVSPDF